MKKIKIILILICTYIMIMLMSNNVSAVSTEREFTDNIGTISYKFNELNLDSSNKRYEWGFTQLKNDNVERWYDLSNFTNNSANVILDPKNNQIGKIILQTDNAFVTIREKGSSNIVQVIEVDLKIPLLQFTDKPILSNGHEFFNIVLKDKIYLKSNGRYLSSANFKDKAYYKYEKITDNTFINKYKDVKKGKGNIYGLENFIKKEIPVSDWKEWHDTSTGDVNGYPESKISVPEEGLYYLWIKVSGTNIKTSYGVILVDNLGTIVPLEGISLSSNYDIRVGDERKLNLEYTPTQASNREVTWESEDKSIATVDSEGRVKGIKAGSTKITAISKDGNKRATTVVNVTEKDNIYAGSIENGKAVNDSVNNKQNVNNTNQRGANNKETIISANDKDNTTAKGRLPQTGESLVAFSAILIIGLVMVVGIKIYNKKFKGI